MTVGDGDGVSNCVGVPEDTQAFVCDGVLDGELDGEGVTAALAVLDALCEADTLVLELPVMVADVEGDRVII